MQCSNHPSLEGPYLCVSCGRWHCPSCMEALSPQPVCKNCAALSRSIHVTVNGPATTTVVSSVQRSVQRKMPVPSGAGSKTPAKRGLSKLQAHLGLGAINLVLGAITAAMFAETGSVTTLFPFLATVLLHIPMARHYAKLAASGSAGKRGDKITDAQIETLFRLADGRVSAKRLADATGTDLETAERCLQRLALENKVTVTSDDHGLIYIKADIPHLD